VPARTLSAADDNGNMADDPTDKRNTSWHYFYPTEYI